MYNINHVYAPHMYMYPSPPQLPQELAKLLRAGMVGAGTTHSTRAHPHPHMHTHPYCPELQTLAGSPELPPSKATQGIRRAFRASLPSSVQHTMGWSHTVPTEVHNLPALHPCRRGPLPQQQLGRRWPSSSRRRRQSQRPHSQRPHSPSCRCLPLTMAPW